MVTRLRVAGFFVIGLAGCTIHTDRTGYSDAWYYERLTPYYTNDLSFTPRVHLRAVKELVGIPAYLSDGTEIHADVFRSDIELFFARAVPVAADRLALARRAIATTCPQTDIADISDKIAFANPNYMVLQNIHCDGYAR